MKTNMASKIRNILPAVGILSLLLAPELRAAQTDIDGPAGQTQQLASPDQVPRLGQHSLRL